jgi:hypothetical protein
MMSFDLHGTTFSLGLPDTHENLETQGLQRRPTRATASTTQNLKHSRYNESTQQLELRKPEGNATRLHAQHRSRLKFPSTSPGFELVPSSSLRMTRHNARSIQQDSYLEKTHIRFREPSAIAITFSSRSFTLSARARLSSCAEYNGRI